MSRLRFRKIGSLLGLLAILLSVLAPTISQTLAAHERLGDALSTFCTVASEPVTSSQDTPDHSLAHHWQACAYCSLLAHVPVLPGTPPQLPAASTLAQIHTTPVAAVVPTVAVHTVAQSRAPPVFS